MIKKVYINMCPILDAWYSYGEKKLAQGRDAVKEMLQADKPLMEEIEGKVREAMKAAAAAAKNAKLKIETGK